MKSLDQARSKSAWDNVKAFKRDHANQFRKYYSLARGFPSMVQSVGIGQSVAFLMSKRKERSHAEYLAHLQGWLHLCGNIAWNPAPLPGDQLIETLKAQIAANAWWQADREAIEYTVWLKRFAEYFEAQTPTAAAVPRVPTPDQAVGTSSVTQE